MATYVYTVTVVVNAANGQGAVPAAVEAEEVAKFVEKVENLGSEFGIGKLEVTATLVP
jgi:hypothetical protein